MKERGTDADDIREGARGGHGAHRRQAPRRRAGAELTEFVVTPAAHGAIDQERAAVAPAARHGDDVLEPLD